MVGASPPLLLLGIAAALGGEAAILFLIGLAEFPPAGGKRIQAFFAATCAGRKILLAELLCPLTRGAKAE